MLLVLSSFSLKLYVCQDEEAYVYVVGDRVYKYVHICLTSKTAARIHAVSCEF